MTTNVKVFKSTDAGAPVLFGNAGGLINILDGILLNGYNSKTITITRSGSTATASCTAHGFTVGQCLLIAGANEADYNGEKYVLTASADAFTFAVSNSPSTPATGTITAKIAPAGWTKPYSGTNLAAYRMGGGNQRYLRVNDANTISARVVGYEAMTTIDVGTGDFPTEAQVSSGLFIHKSNAADASARAWVAIATDRLLHLWTSASATAGLLASVNSFGDIKAYAGGDQFATILNAQTSYSATSAAAYNLACLTAAYGTTVTGLYLSRGYTQVGSSVAAGRHSDAAKAKSLTAVIGAAGLEYPSATDGGLYLSPTYIHETAALRGSVPGVWAPLHQRPLANLDTFQGSGTLSGKSFIVLNMDGSPAAVGAGQLFLETSNTWDI